MSKIQCITSDAALKKAAKVQLAVFDVDGVMTDGRIYYDTHGNETKAFNALDGLGLKALQSYGISIAIITARSSPIVSRRAAELGIEHVIQGESNKKKAMLTLMKQLNVSSEFISYIGDDLQDLPALQLAGFSATVANGHWFVKQQVDVITNAHGGNGAVREICEVILSAQGHIDGWCYQFLE